MYRKIISLLVSLSMMICLIVPEAFAASGSPYVTRGKYSISASYGYNRQLTDEFVFDEECFRESSFKGCSHLALLSMQAAAGSSTRYGSYRDVYGRNFSEGYYNIVNMLKAMGFRNVEHNKYYGMRMLEDSIGVAVGSRSLKVLGKTYTLIAVIPRSDDYWQEWSGNFNVGTGKIHAGFKAARDEVLRFVRKYINDHGIKGAVKVWTAGHSRGAAVANMTAAFLAGGGISYFGGKLTIRPRDIYCYCTATPRHVMNGAPKEEELSVSGARGGVYKADTAGKAYVYTGGGEVDLSDPVYRGIRNYCESYDMITFLPPESWGYECYGRRLSVDSDGEVTRDKMLAMLKDLNSEVYDQYMSGKGKDDFKWMKFDLATMKITEDTSVPADKGIEDMIREREAGLTANAGNEELYVNGGYEESLKAMSCIYGMLERLLSGRIKLNVSNIDLILKIWRAYSEERNAAEERGVSPEMIPYELPEIANSELARDADAKLVDAIESIVRPQAEKTEEIYGTPFYNDVTRHIDNLESNVTDARRLISYTLFYTEGESYDANKSLNTAFTLLSNVSILLTTHYKEVYLSWAKARAVASNDQHNTGQAEYDRTHKEKKAQSLRVRTYRKTMKASRLRKRSKTVTAIKVISSKGKVTFTKKSGSRRLKLNRKTGKITIRKGTKKGKYRIRVLVKAAGNSTYKKAQKTVTATIILR